MGATRIGSTGTLISRNRVHIFADYNSLIFEIDYNKQEITFFRNWNFSKSTRKHTNEAMRIAGCSKLNSSDIISNAIKDGKWTNGADIEFKVKYSEEE